MGEMELLGVSVKDDQYYMELADDDGCKSVPIEENEAMVLMIGLASGRNFYATEVEDESQ